MKTNMNIVTVLCICFVSVVVGDGMGMCNLAFEPLLKVADFDANGVVDDVDISMLAEHMQVGPKQDYFALYDLTADRKVDVNDLKLAIDDIGLTSDVIDQEIATMFQGAVHLRGAKTDAEWLALGVSDSDVPLAGHGTHWLTVPTGLLTYRGVVSKYTDIVGLNIADEGPDKDNVVGLYWSAIAQPVFVDANGNEGFFDYFTCGPIHGQLSGCVWMDYHVVRYDESILPHPTLTHNPCEHWHAHPAMCIYETMDGVGHFDQHLTYNQCMATQNVNPNPLRTQAFGVYPLAWTNTWMVHAWLFNPSSKGIHGNTNDCIDPNFPPESSINARAESYGWSEPMYFHMMHTNMPMGCGMSM